MRKAFLILCVSKIELLAGRNGICHCRTFIDHSLAYNWISVAVAEESEIAALVILLE